MAMKGNAKFGSMGASLIEMMIAMVLGLMITAGVISVFLSVKRTYTENERSARIQETGRVALYLLTNDLRHVNFWGAMLNADNVDTPLDAPFAGFTGPCSSWASQGSGTVLISNRLVASTDPASTAPFNNNCLTVVNIKPGTSAVAIKRVGNGSVNASGLANGAVFLRAHSTNAELLAKGTTEGNVPLPSGWEDWVYEPSIYYIRNFQKIAADGVPTLCEVQGNPSMRERCLVAGIEDMQIEYGIDTFGIGVPSKYTADGSAEIEDAVTIKIYLLVRDAEPDPHYTNSKAYTLGTKNVAAFNDNFHRAVFSTTVIPHNQRYLPIK